MHLDNDHRHQYHHSTLWFVLPSITKRESLTHRADLKWWHNISTPFSILNNTTYLAITCALQCSPLSSSDGQLEVRCSRFTEHSSISRLHTSSGIIFNSKRLQVRLLSLLLICCPTFHIISHGTGSLVFVALQYARSAYHKQGAN